jgi:hypothetical protein
MAVQDNLGARLCPLVVVLSTEVLFAETGKGNRTRVSVDSIVIRTLEVLASVCFGGIRRLSPSRPEARCHD